MSTSGLEDKVRFDKFWIDGDHLCLKVKGKSKPIRRHKSISFKLAAASARQLSKFEVLGDGEGVSWLSLDEDISAAFFVYPERFSAVSAKKKNVA
jgi:hypothetical protein